MNLPPATSVRECKPGVAEVVFQNEPGVTWLAKLVAKSGRPKLTVLIRNGSC